jgi:hypothetical protein
MLQIMPSQQNPLYANVHQGDPLQFWANREMLDFNRVTEFLDFDKNALSKIGGVSKDSVRLDKRIPKDLKERLEQIANICNLVAEYFDGNSQKTALWFRTPNPMLGNVSPRDMIRLGRYQRLLQFIVSARAENESTQPE